MNNKEAIEIIEKIYFIINMEILVIIKFILILLWWSTN